MVNKSPKRRKDYIKAIKDSYNALKSVSNYNKLPHHQTLEKTLLDGKKLKGGDLVDLLQLSVIHDIHGENDPKGEKKKFEPEYSRCIASLNDEFETRLTFVDALVNYARGPEKTLNGKGIQKWRNIKKQLKDLRYLIKQQDLPVSKAQVYFADHIDRSREALVQFNLYLSQAYHFPGK